MCAHGGSNLVGCQRAGGEGVRPNAAGGLTIAEMPDAHMRDAIDRLAASGAITEREASDFLAHREHQRHFVEDAWRRADDLAPTDSPAAEARRREIITIIRSLGWEPGVDIP